MVVVVWSESGAGRAPGVGPESGDQAFVCGSGGCRIRL